jgi:hypothetical protein
MGIELRDEPFPVFLDDARGLDAAFVILEPLFGWEPRHADVVARLAVAFRVAQIDDVDGMVTGWCLGQRLFLGEGREQ